ncbi:MAG: ECF-type sigma factor [Pirellulales bacterium]
MSSPSNQDSAQYLPLVYDELRQMARALLAKEPPGQTLDATSLVHEAYLRLRQRHATAPEPWMDRAHFFRAAAMTMRRILVDNARRKACVKHGGEHVRADRQLDQILPPRDVVDLVALDEALSELAAADPQAAALVELRYFSGMTIPEAAEVLGISSRLADSLWAYSRAWLRAYLLDH